MKQLFLSMACQVHCRSPHGERGLKLSRAGENISIAKSRSPRIGSHRPAYPEEITLTREEWYEIYTSAGNGLP